MRAPDDGVVHYHDETRYFVEYLVGDAWVRFGDPTQSQSSVEEAQEYFAAVRKVTARSRIVKIRTLTTIARNVIETDPPEEDQ